MSYDAKAVRFVFDVTRSGHESEAFDTKTNTLKSLFVFNTSILELFDALII